MENVKPILKFKINPKIKYEWSMKEYGSYEDGGCEEGHIYKLISRGKQDEIIAYTEEEIDELSGSFNYFRSFESSMTLEDMPANFSQKLNRIDNLLNQHNH